MIRLTVYILLALSIALLASWFASNPGQVMITWQEWEIRFSTAVLIFLVVIYTGLLWAAIWVMRKLNIFAYFSDPKRLAAKRAKGERDLDQGWSAYALEDYKEAIKFGLRAKSILGESGGVLRLLASASLKKGEDKNPYLERLKASPASAPWVLSQELGHSLEQQSWSAAVPMVQDMLKSHPHNKSLLKLDFLLSARLGNWQVAKAALEKAIREKGTLNPGEQKHFPAVIDYCLALEEKAAGNKNESLRLVKLALKNDPSFAPAALLGARVCIEQDNKKEAEKILGAIWKVNPNIEVAELLAELYPLESSGETFRRLKKVTESAPTFSESHHLMADAAIAAEHWPDAHRALEAVINSDQASKRTYQTLALLERKQKNDQVASDKLLEKSERAPSDNHWVCSSCQKSPTHYTPVCEKCGAFDKISWFRR
tara:strand:- start:112068 stop:113351 length:1284 start_codon:yes stop_codon:yes gene_type:complete